MVRGKVTAVFGTNIYKYHNPLIDMEIAVENQGFIFIIRRWSE